MTGFVELRRELAGPARLGQTCPIDVSRSSGRALVAVAADLARQLEAVHLGHLHVEHGDVERIAAADAGERVRSGRSTASTSIPHALRLRSDDLAVRRVVVDDQQTLAREPEPSVAVGRGVPRARRLLRDDLEVEGRALALLALHPERAAHQLRQALRDRKAQPGAAVAPCRRGVHLAERLEQPVHSLRRESRCRCPGRRSAAAADRRLRPPPSTCEDDLPDLGELDGVREQVAKRLPQPRRVADDRVPARRRPQGSRARSPSRRHPRRRGRARPRRTRARRGGAPRARACRPRSSRSRGCRR